MHGPGAITHLDARSTALREGDLCNEATCFPVFAIPTSDTTHRC